MATKQFYAAKDFKYGTRMLRAGDGPFPMDGPTARLYGALGAITPTKPKGVVPAMTTDDVVEPSPPRAPRKRTTKKATAKKAK